MFTLFQTITTEGWAEIARSCMENQLFIGCFFIFVIPITTFAIMDVVIAVIVDNTLDQALLQENDISKQLESQ